MTRTTTPFTPVVTTTNDTPFHGKTLSSVSGSLGTLVRVWKDTPHVATVPAVDAKGRTFEFVFLDGRKQLFDAFARDLLSKDGLSIEATGFWRKRTWKKTRSLTGKWGYTWQFIVAACTLLPTNGTPITFGHVPNTMVDPTAASPNLPFVDSCPNLCS